MSIYLLFICSCFRKYFIFISGNEDTKPSSAYIAHSRFTLRERERGRGREEMQILNAKKNSDCFLFLAGLRQSEAGHIKDARVGFIFCSQCSRLLLDEGIFNLK